MVPVNQEINSARAKKNINVKEYRRLNMFIVKLPRMDPGMKEGTIIQWLKKEGERVEKGDPIAKDEGQKVIFDVRAPEAGIIGKILIPEGNSVKIATKIAVIVNSDEKIPEIEEEMHIPEEIKPSARMAIVETPKKMTGRIRASPLARKIAKEKNIDLNQIQGSGSNGRIQKKDVLIYIENTSEVNQQSRTVEIVEEIILSGMRKTIADRMSHSYKNIPQLSVAMEVNMYNMLKFREKMEKIKIPFTAFLTKMTAIALKKFPIVNSTFDEDKIKIFKNINVGVAVAIEEGLIVPVIFNVDMKSLVEISSILSEKIEKARKRELSFEDLKDGTFTITNLGGFGVDFFTPIINPPQAAILGVGKITDKPRVIEGEIKILPVMTLTLTFDHRIINGVKAAQFLNEIKEIIEEPSNVF